MTVAVVAADEQSAEPIDVERWSALAHGVLEAEAVAGTVELSMLFVDEDIMSELNGRFRGKEGSTDVLSFPLDEPDGAVGEGTPSLLGDVVICPTVARRNAAEHHRSYEDELALLVVHGTLHLLGMDHLDDEEATAMEAREQALLARLHRP
jgi:probable rRNA maturation factor